MRGAAAAAVVVAVDGWRVAIRSPSPRDLQTMKKSLKRKKKKVKSSQSSDSHHLRSPLNK